MKKKRGREDESYNISEIMSKEVKIKGEGHIMFYVVYNLCDIDNYYLKVYWLLIFTCLFSQLSVLGKRMVPSSCLLKDHELDLVRNYYNFL